MALSTGVSTVPTHEKKILTVRIAERTSGQLCVPIATVTLSEQPEELLGGWRSVWFSINRIRY